MKTRIALLAIFSLSAPRLALAQEPVAEPPAPAAPAAPAEAPAAALPATAPAAPDPAAAADPAAGNIDLSALGLQDESQSSGRNDTPLNVYGFADFSYFHPLTDKDSYLGSATNHYQQFAIGNFNLYLSKQMSEKTRSMAEVRFSYMPNGATDAAKPGDRVSTFTPDPADVNRPIPWGGIVIERVHVEYDVTSFLTLRAGQFLTPYGIWNVDHGTPTLISIRRPYMIGDQLFPERQVGLEAFGKAYLSEFELQYILTLSNGRGPIDTIGDLDNNKAVGGRLEAKYTHNFDARLGGSFYKGRYTDRKASTFDFVTMKTVEPIKLRYDEVALGVDFQLNWGDFVWRSEFVHSQVHFKPEDRPMTDATTFQPDYRVWGYYLLAGYRLPFGVMPYFLFSPYHFAQRPSNALVPYVVIVQPGLNIQVTPSIIVKLEYSSATFSESPALLKDKPYSGFEAQVSWVF
jgi:hypothetical protein